MTDVNLRGTFMLTRACLPFLHAAGHAHVLTLGLAADEAEHAVGADCLWPRTLIATPAVRNLLGGAEEIRRSRTPEIVADGELTLDLFVDDWPARADDASRVACPAR
jgi:NAD(P)-dependent dehydrogenase (short-subunit alcohol dehydrogenase family)